MDVKDVGVGVLDATGAMIETVYVKNTPRYAIYSTAQRVMVHFADDAEERRRQQEILTALNPTRGEINGLIDGWRASKQQDKEALTRLFDRRVADALAMALENDSATAELLLKGTLDEISEERKSRGRIEQLFYAAIAAAALALISVLASWHWDPQVPTYFADPLNALFLAAAVGAFGALVSIGIAIKERSLATDFQTRDNIADAILRVTVGAVGAVLLVAMLRSELIDLEIGNFDVTAALRAEPQPQETEPPPPPGDTGTTNQAAIAPGNEAEAAVLPVEEGNSQSAAADQGAPQPAPPAATEASDGSRVRAGDRGTERGGDRERDDGILVLLVIAFFAGFSERLVSRLAERVPFRELAVSAVAGADTGRRGRGGNGGGGNGGGALPPGGPDGAPEPPGAVTPQIDATDGCIADAETPEEEATDDTQLPPAAGGVEEPVGDENASDEAERS